MRWFKGIAIALGALLAILVAVPFFYSLDDYIPTLEQEASARLNEPVKIGKLRVATVPLPHLTVDDITVGKSGDLKVGKVTVTPDLWSLLDATKVIKSIEIDSVVLTQKGIEKIPAWTKTDKKPEEPARIRVEAIRLQDVLVKLDTASFGPFDAQVSVSGTGEAESVALATRDGKLTAHVKPEKAKYRFEANAKGWKPPAGPAIHFDELAVKGIATANDAVLDDVRARLYGGTVNGRATVGWQKGLQLKGNASVHQVELKPLVPLLAKGVNVSGKLNAKPVFSARASEAKQLMNALHLETPFDVRDGVLYGMDISKAATSLISKEGSKGGETRFDTLSGHLVMDRGVYRLTQLDIASGSLAAEGHVTISRQQELSGRINTKVKAASVTAANVPLNVSGTVQNPVLMPTGGVVAGAVAGTAVLGPGLGTSVGARVGGWVEGLFGKKEETKDGKR
ncbi:MAG: AsmA family protein [Betaproteobacteria bacterium]|nr:AsmA family protein [Betaproteobacteria bacterium]